MGSIYIPEGDYYNAIGENSREINRIRDGAPQHPGTLFIYVLGKVRESPFSQGKTVYVKAPGYDFSANVWYTYQGTNGYNLYVKHAYNGDVYSGVVSTSPIIEGSSGDNLDRSEPVIETAKPDLVSESGAKGGNRKLLWFGLLAVAALVVWKKMGGKKGGKKGGKGKK